MSADNRFTDNSPFASPSSHDPYTPRRSSSRTMLWVLLGGGAMLALLCCGGGGGVVMFGLHLMTAEIKEQVRDNPKLREHVGEITSLEYDIMGSMATQGDDTYRYRVRGTKGEGELTVRHHTNDQGDEVIDEAWLRLPSGEKIKIAPLDENEK